MGVFVNSGTEPCLERLLDITHEYRWLRCMGGNFASLQGAGAEHFALTEGLKGGGGHAGEGNRVAQCVEDFDGVPLCAIRGHVMVDQFDNVPAAETMLPHIGIGNRMSKASSRRALHVSE